MLVSQQNQIICNLIDVKLLRIWVLFCTIAVYDKMTESADDQILVMIKNSSL
jgi:hypothetical protein